MRLLIILLLSTVVIFSGCARMQDIGFLPPGPEKIQVNEKSEVYNFTEPSNQTAKRWGKLHLSVFIDEEASEKTSGFERQMVSFFKKAAALLSASSNNRLSFEYAGDKNSSDIEVVWVENLPADSLDAVGHTELIFVPSGGFDVIKSAKISLLALRNGKPLNTHNSFLLSLHELGHAIGLDHTNRTQSIMFPQLQESLSGFSQEDIETIKGLYKTEPLPDLQIYEASVVKKLIERGLSKRHLADVNFSVVNNGLSASFPFDFSIKAGDTLIINNSAYLSGDKQNSLDIGSSFTISYFNISSDADFSNVTISIDTENRIRELNETNTRTIMIT